MAKTGTINLLPQEEFEASTLGRVLRWATGSFRIIVIVTEMIVMGAFLSRFWLDAQNSDLTDSITIKTAQINAQKDVETTFRQIQTKLDIFKNIAGSAQTSSTINLTASKTPTDVTLSSISVDPKQISLRGTSVSELGIAQFISNLKAEKSFKSVELGSVSSSQTIPGNTDFALVITY